MTSQELDEIRAAGEGMIDRREDKHHPVNTDPPKPTGPHEPTTRAEAPAVGTRVKCLMAHRGEFGSVVAWDEDLGLPIVEWDSVRGEEAVEAHEYTTDLNQED